jgi:hypothetical protein
VTFDDSLRKIQKNPQRGEADRPFKGRSGGGYTDRSISSPQSNSIGINRSDSRTDRRMLSHGDTMSRQSPGSNPRPLSDEKINARKLSNGDIMDSKGANY